MPIINQEVTHDCKNEHYNVKAFFLRLCSITKQLHDGLLPKIEVAIKNSNYLQLFVEMFTLDNMGLPIN